MRASLLAWLVLSTTAHAGWCDYEAPPIEMQGEPTINYWTEELPVEELDAICADAGSPPGMTGGCVSVLVNSPDGDYQIIYVREDLSDEDLRCVLLHEKAHLPPNNWQHGENWQQRTYPLWRRPSHVDPFMFARGRVGANPR